MAKRQGQSFALIAPVSAMLVIAALAFNTHDLSSGSSDISLTEAKISIEHATAATVRVDLGSGKDQGIAEITPEGSGTVAIAVPATWKRREVRGAALADVTQDPEGLGAIRWHIPGGTTLSFWNDESPALAIHNASDTPLLILGKRVNVLTGTVEEKSMLIEKKGVRLW